MWDIMRHIVVIFFYRPLKMGPMDCHEKYVRNNRYRLRYIPEEHTPHLLRNGSRKLRRFRLCYVPYFTCHLILFNCLLYNFLCSRDA